MRRTKFIAASVVVASMAGCAGMADEQFKNDVLSSRDMSSDTASAIKAGSVAVGMTKAQVRAAWGKPTQKSQASYGSRWRWGYKRLATPLPEEHVVKFDNSDRVFEWVEPQ